MHIHQVDLLRDTVDELRSELQLALRRTQASPSVQVEEEQPERQMSLADSLAESLVTDQVQTDSTHNVHTLKTNDRRRSNN